MSSVRAAVLLFALVVTCRPAHAAVVINEILYHAPDDLDDLQFIELHNTGDTAIDLAGWKLTRGVRYEFPRNAKIEANGYLVVCKNLRQFKRYYGSDAAGQFEGSLRHGRGHIELIDAKARKVDEVQYRSRAPDRKSV